MGKNLCFEIQNSDILLSFNILSYFYDKSAYELKNIIDANKFSFENINEKELKLLFFLLIVCNVSLDDGNTYVSLKEIAESENIFIAGKLTDFAEVLLDKLSDRLDSLGNNLNNKRYFYKFDTIENILSIINSLKINAVDESDEYNENKEINDTNKNNESIGRRYLFDEKVTTSEFYIPLIFIIENNDKVYFRRFYIYEMLIAQNIGKRLFMDKSSSLIDDNKLQQKLNIFLSIFEKELDPLQLEALKCSVLSNFILITGGPGTGKTFILSLIILAHMYLYGLNKKQIIAIAPTGKAANRILEVLKEKIVYLNDKIPDNQKEKFGINLSSDQLLIDSMTIHRFLGSSEFKLSLKHNRENPASQKLIIVDEASMIDIPLMAKLLDAIDDHSKIFLSGDSNQLSSVEAGRVFADIKEFLSEKGYTGKNLIELKKSYRYEKDSFVEKVREKLDNIFIEKDKQKKDYIIDEFIDFVERNNRLLQSNDFFKNEIFNKIINRLNELGYNDIFDFETPINLNDSHKDDKSIVDKKEFNQFQKLNKKFKILTPLKFTTFGTYNLNNIFANFLRTKNYSSFVPIIIMKNNYQLNLFNGDIGFLYSEDEKAYAYFEEDSNENIRKFPLTALSNWEPAYSITVHKGQGSEFDIIILIIPDDIEKYQFISLELIYTAITRAKKDFIILGSKDNLKSALKNRTKRDTGLFDKLQKYKDKL